MEEVAMEQEKEDFVDWKMKFSVFPQHHQWNFILAD